MNNDAMPLQPHRHAPFLPSCLSDRIEAVRRRPRKFNWRTAAALERIGTPSAQDSPVRRSYRTYMLDDAGRLADAKIDLRTGEVVQCKYARAEPLLKARPKKDPVEEDPFWMKDLPDSTTSKVEDHPIAVDRSRRKCVNRAKPLLEHYIRLEEAIDDYPILDHVLTGGAALSLGGNTRALNRGRLFHMLQHLDTISAGSVRESMGYSKSHSEKLVNVLRVVEAGFVRLLQHRTLIAILASPK